MLSCILNIGKREISQLVAFGVSMIIMPTTQAAQITQVDFNATAIVESFEGLAPGTNITSADAGFLVPAVVAPYRFASGVTLSSPSTQTDLGTGFFVGDFSRGDAAFGLGDSGIVASAADLSSGTAYFGYNDFASSGSVEFTFTSSISLVGAYVDASLGADFLGAVSLSAFDSNGQLLETISLDGVSVSNWGTNFLGMQNSDIRRIQFSGDFFVLDNLTFQAQPSIAVPEPSTAMLSVPWFGFLAWVARHRLRLRHSRPISRQRVSKDFPIHEHQQIR
jgi:hypothetical protein